MTLSIGKGIAGLLAGALLVPMFAFADTNAKVGINASASTTPAQRTCMQTATSVKADANLAALDALFASFRSAFVTHKNASVAAWGMEDGSARVQAIVSANTAFSASVKNSWKTYRTARATASTTYKASVQACGIANGSQSGNRDHDDKDKGDQKRAKAWSKFHLNLGLFR